MTRFIQGVSPTGRWLAPGESLADVEIAAEEAIDTQNAAMFRWLRNLAAEGNAKVAEDAEARRNDPAFRRREMLEALVPPPGRHPLNSEEGRELLGDLRAAGRRAEWVARLARLILFLADRAESRGCSSREQAVGWALWAMRLDAALGADFQGPPHRAREVLRAREDARRVDGMNTGQAAAYLARKCRITTEAARKRVKRACAETGLSLPPSPRGGPRPRKG